MRSVCVCVTVAGSCGPCSCLSAAAAHSNGSNCGAETQFRGNAAKQLPEREQESHVPPQESEQTGADANTGIEREGAPRWAMKASDDGAQDAQPTQEDDAVPRATVQHDEDADKEEEKMEDGDDARLTAPSPPDLENTQTAGDDARTDGKKRKKRVEEAEGPGGNEGEEADLLRVKKAASVYWQNHGERRTDEGDDGAQDAQPTQEDDVVPRATAQHDENVDKEEGKKDDGGDAQLTAPSLPELENTQAAGDAASRRTAPMGGKERSVSKKLMILKGAKKKEKPTCPA